MTVSLTFSQSFFEQNVSPTVKIIAIFDVIFEPKVTLLHDSITEVFAELFRTKFLRTAEIIAIFSDFFFKIKPEMRDILAKIRECGK